MKISNTYSVLLFVIIPFYLFGQEANPAKTNAIQSVARQWNEALLNAIRIDLPRPTVHACNLFHFSIASYDAWAAYDDKATTFMLGKTIQGFETPFDGVVKPADINSARNQAISYAAYRLLSFRFKSSPGAGNTLPAIQQLMNNLGYDPSFTSVDYSSGSPAALGNYIASKIIEFGLQDGTNEGNGYVSQFYQPVNHPLRPDIAGSQNLVDCNRWQPLRLGVFTDQNGIQQGTTQPFLTPEWGKVIPFALSQNDLKVFNRDGHDYFVYHDPGAPPQLDTANSYGQSPEYMWGFSLVSIWASHLDQSDGVMIDISPSSKGNIALADYPTSPADYRNFYKLTEGGDIGKGYSTNPRTNQPYTPQVVPRGDYARVLAEFWADGPRSETPPGHWFTLLNYVSDHPLATKKFQGRGDRLNDLEWDVKAYLILGGALHDVAVTAWGIKGYYDGVRPISAIRFMSDKGQSSDSQLPRYDPYGIPLMAGYIELVKVGDLLAGVNNENVDKVKLYTWRGPKFITMPNKQAGVGWILAENWYPYQRTSFVTPPFAGYISGHSTFSSAGAEVLTLLTGDEYFPGGLGEFVAKKNAYLVFENGPSVDVKLQWARYKDASDQSALSRIWGGIHPPADDIPGRSIGKKIGANAFKFAVSYFENVITEIPHTQKSGVNFYPNPIKGSTPLHVVKSASTNAYVQLLDILGRIVFETELTSDEIKIDVSAFSSGIYIFRLSEEGKISSQRVEITK